MHKLLFLISLALLLPTKAEAGALADETTSETDNPSTVGMLPFSPLFQPSLLSIYERTECFLSGSSGEGTFHDYAEREKTNARASYSSLDVGFILAPEKNPRARLAVRYDQDSFDTRMTMIDGDGNEAKIKADETTKTMELTGSFAITPKLVAGLTGRIYNTAVKASYEGLDVIDESGSFHAVIPSLTLNSGSMSYTVAKSPTIHRSDTFNLNEPGSLTLSVIKRTPHDYFGVSVIRKAYKTVDETYDDTMSVAWLGRGVIVLNLE